MAEAEQSVPSTQERGKENDMNRVLTLDGAEMSTAPAVLGNNAKELEILNVGEAPIANSREIIPRVDKLPKQVWIMALACGIERFAFYALNAVLQNYMQNPRHGSENPGALNLGQQTATAISNAFLLLQFIGSLGFAILSDSRLGRMNTLLTSLIVYQCGFLTLFLTSLPVALDHGGGLPGLIVALILVAVGVAGLKATMPPLIVDQYTRTEPVILKTEHGRIFVSDRQLTIQFITNMIFWVTNLGTMSMVATTYLEKKVDFWASYLMGFLSLTLSQVLLLWQRKNLVIVEAEKSALPLAAKALWCAICHGFSLKRASPEFQRERYDKEVPWDASTLQDVKKALVICRVLVFSCPFYLVAIQVFNNLISQAGQMRLYGIPNDLMQVFNPVACIVLGPLIQRGVFPLLRRAGISFGAIARVATGCLIMAAAMGYAAGNQHLIYSYGPCYDHPRACPAAHGPDGKVVGNNISVWIQIPVWFITATGEILGFATISEIAYEMSPRNMRSLMQSVTQFTAGLATVLGIALSPLTKDPTLVILYSVIAGLTFLAAILFWLFFKKLDKRDGSAQS